MSYLAHSNSCWSQTTSSQHSVEFPKKEEGKRRQIGPEQSKQLRRTKVEVRRRAGCSHYTHYTLEKQTHLHARAHYQILKYTISSFVYANFANLELWWYHAASRCVCVFFDELRLSRLYWGSEALSLRWRNGEASSLQIGFCKVKPRCSTIADSQAPNNNNMSRAWIRLVPLHGFT